MLVLLNVHLIFSKPNLELVLDFFETSETSDVV